MQKHVKSYTQKMCMHTAHTRKYYLFLQYPPKVIADIPAHSLTEKWQLQTEVELVFCTSGRILNPLTYELNLV